MQKQVRETILWKEVVEKSMAKLDYMEKARRDDIAARLEADEAADRRRREEREEAESRHKQEREAAEKRFQQEREDSERRHEEQLRMTLAKLEVSARGTAWRFTNLLNTGGERERDRQSDSHHS